jgi:hypothetical protein
MPSRPGPAGGKTSGRGWGADHCAEPRRRNGRHLRPARAGTIDVMPRREAAHLAHQPYGTLVQSAPRTGAVNAAGILPELGEHRRGFPAAAQLAAEAGVVPVTHNYGTHRDVAVGSACSGAYGRSAAAMTRPNTGGLSPPSNLNHPSQMPPEGRSVDAGCLTPHAGDLDRETAPTVARPCPRKPRSRHRFTPQEGMGPIGPDERCGQPGQDPGRPSRASPARPPPRVSVGTVSPHLLDDAVGQVAPEGRARHHGRRHVPGASGNLPLARAHPCLLSSRRSGSGREPRRPGGSRPARLCAPAPAAARFAARRSRVSLEVFPEGPVRHIHALGRLGPGVLWTMLRYLHRWGLPRGRPFDPGDRKPTR